MVVLGILHHESKSPAVFASHFGVSVHDMDDLWLILKHESFQYGFEPHHLFLDTLLYKNHIYNLSGVSHLQCSRNIFWYWVYIGLDLVISCLPKVYTLCQY
jgi:hypothetical protein